MSNPSQLLFEFMADRRVPKRSQQNQSECLTASDNADCAIVSSPADAVDKQFMSSMDDDNAFVDRLDYTIKVSARARQVLLRIQPGLGLVVTIPKRFAKRDVPLVLKDQRQWIEQNLVAMDSQVPDEYKIWPPSLLKLEACACDVLVEYTYAKGAGPRARWLGPARLRLNVDQEDRTVVCRLIAGAVRQRARKLLTERIAVHASQHGFYYKKLSVRAQRSVWGSYSSSGTLSLNYKLIFLRPDLVDYVLLHELAHTRYLNHSPAFWRLVESLHPNARALDKELNSACRNVPPWLEVAA